MAKLTESQLRNQIKTGSFENAYLIYGEESYLKEYYISKIIKKVVDPAFEAFNLHRFDSEDVAVDDIIKDAQMLPMMSRYNVVLVRDYPVEKNKSDIRAVTEFLSDVPDSTIFILEYDALKPDVKSSGFRKIVSAFDSAGAVADLEKRSESDIARMLAKGAEKRGSSLSMNNALYLVSVSGSDIKSLLNELDKLSYYAHGREITRDIIDNMATKSLQAKVYDISKAVVVGNADKAYSALDILLNMKEDPILILAVIAGIYVDMYRVKCAKSAGLGYDDAAVKFNYKGREFALRNASRDCASLTADQLRRSLDEISSTDIKLKSTAADKKTLLEELIIKLVMIVREVSYA